jgi:hypothetical protein
MTSHWPVTTSQWPVSDQSVTVTDRHWLASHWTVVCRICTLASSLVPTSGEEIWFEWVVSGLPTSSESWECGMDVDWVCRDLNQQFLGKLIIDVIVTNKMLLHSWLAIPFLAIGFSDESWWTRWCIHLGCIVRSFFHSRFLFFSSLFLSLHLQPPIPTFNSCSKIDT